MSLICVKRFKILKTPQFSIFLNPLSSAVRTPTPISSPPIKLSIFFLLPFSSSKKKKKNVQGSLMSDKCRSRLLLQTVLNPALKGSSKEQEKEEKEERPKKKNQTTRKSPSSPPEYTVLRLPSSRGWELAHLGTAKIARCTDLGIDEPRSAMAMPNRWRLNNRF
jgi:hypothetical protein